MALDSTIDSRTPKYSPPRRSLDARNRNLDPSPTADPGGVDLLNMASRLLGPSFAIEGLSCHHSTMQTQSCIILREGDLSIGSWCNASVLTKVGTETPFPDDLRLMAALYWHL